MYQYSNDAYNSADKLPQSRLRPNYSNNSVNRTETVGIGYYGVSRQNQAASKNKSNMAGSSTLSPTSPSSRTIFDNSAERNSYLWNYLHEGIDLSPQGRGNQSRSPARPVSEGSALDAYNRSHISNGQRAGSSSVPLLGYNEYSPQSTEQSSHSFVDYPLLRKHSGVSSRGIDQGNKQVALSPRARWERDHMHGSHTSKSQQSPSTLSKSIGKDSRQTDGGDKPNRQYMNTVNTSQSPQSTLERDYNTYSTSSSLRRDPLSHKKLMNGSVRVHEGSLNTSGRSLNISRLSLRSQSGKLVLYGKGYGVHNSLANMALAALLSLVMCYLSVQLLFRVSTRQSAYLFSSDSVLSSNLSHANVSEVVVALTSIAIMLDLCCLLTCVLQGYFAAKLMKCKQGQERAFHYLKECMPTRFIAVVGFFFSVPAFFFGLMLYIIMEYRSTPAIIAVVVLTVGISFCISMASHSTYVWFTEKSNANKDIPVVFHEKTGNKTKIINGELTNKNELSTLV